MVGIEFKRSEEVCSTPRPHAPHREASREFHRHRRPIYLDRVRRSVDLVLFDESIMAAASSLPFMFHRSSPPYESPARFSFHPRRKLSLIPRTATPSSNTSPPVTVEPPPQIELEFFGVSPTSPPSAPPRVSFLFYF